MKKIVFLFVLAIAANFSFAEGYQVNMQSARQTGMGHVGAGMKLGSESMFFNPAGLSFMNKKSDFSLGGSLVYSNVNFNNELYGNYDHDTDSPAGTPFFVYGAMKLNEKLAVGLSVTSPFGSTINWGDDWLGKAIVQDISLKAIYFQPTVSYKLSEKLSIGGGVVFAYGAVDYNKDASLTLPDNSVVPGQVNLNGSTTAWGFNLGLMYDVSETVTVGFNYRSKVEMDVEDGDADFTYPVANPMFPQDGNFTAVLPLPANGTFGISWKASDKWLIAADLQYVFWDTYESLNFGFPGQEYLNLSMQKNFSNTMIYRVGGEYMANEKLTLRAGAYYDSTPIDLDLYGPETPGMDKVGVSAGASYKIAERLSIDAALLYINGSEVEGSVPTDAEGGTFFGNYETRAWLPTLGVHFSF